LKVLDGGGRGEHRDPNKPPASPCSDTNCRRSLAVGTPGAGL
jgi:hypothetical protein